MRRNREGAWRKRGEKVRGGRGRGVTKERSSGLDGSRKKRDHPFNQKKSG